MLKVTVELWPGGRESGRLVIATADIVRVKNGQLADYEVRLHDDVLGDIGTATLTQYPRFAGSVLDLAARAIATALAGGEELPPRPILPDVPVHKSGTTPYVRMREIPEPARTLFAKNMFGSTCPYIEEDSEPMGCVYAWDWEAFLSGAR
ncbi:hypothetical protein RI103_02285 [Paraburkholderia sp. FT54]|uniref:hypothetical protein n=1 Tax=Paraburkholderia sp. FT54 TaxID=3074437 RepID=UPI002877BF57|nr:hypothetical protein [Paraburkholderia sp. FT54]WNC90211.1 hypothetical protein RI103_02285 [Paraburkholderia sp. FT54]